MIIPRRNDEFCLGGSGGFMKFQSGTWNLKKESWSLKKEKILGAGRVTIKVEEASCAKAKGTSGWDEVLWRKI